jgi:acetyl esterase/lipase
LKSVTVGLIGVILAISAGVSGCSDDPPAAVKPAVDTAVAAAGGTAVENAADALPSDESEISAEGEEGLESTPAAYAPYSSTSRDSSPKASSALSTSSSPSSAASKVSDASDSSSKGSGTSLDSPTASSSTTDATGSLGSGIGASTVGSLAPSATPQSATQATASSKDALLAKAQTFASHLLLAGQSYRNRSEQTLYFDVYFPANFKTSSTGPYVFVVHGGDWTEGAKEDVKPFAIALAEKGIVAIAPDYRLAPAHPHPAQVNDLSDLMEYVETNLNILYTTGTSYGAVGVAAGGHLTSLVALSPTASGKLTCAANVFSQTNLTSLSTLDAEVKQFLGDNYSPEALTEASPLYLIPKRAASPKFFLSHGTADNKVPYAQSEEFAAALKSNGVSVTLKSVTDGQHGYGEAQTKTTAAEIAAFMTSCLPI